jgi:hypothetical protein
MAAFAPTASMHNCIGNWNKRQVYADPQPAQADKNALAQMISRRAYFAKFA